MLLVTFTGFVYTLENDLILKHFFTFMKCITVSLYVLAFTLSTVQLLPPPSLTVRTVSSSSASSSTVDSSRPYLPSSTISVLWWSQVSGHAPPLPSTTHPDKNSCAPPAPTVSGRLHQARQPLPRQRLALKEPQEEEEHTARGDATARKREGF